MERQGVPRKGMSRQCQGIGLGLGMAMQVKPRKDMTRLRKYRHAKAKES